MPKTKTKKIEPYQKGYDTGYRVGRREAQHEWMFAGADLVVASAMYYLAEQTNATTEDIIKFYDGMIFYMDRVRKGYMTLDQMKQSLHKSYNIEFTWDEDM